MNFLRNMTLLLLALSGTVKPCFECCTKKSTVIRVLHQAPHAPQMQAMSAGLAWPSPAGAVPPQVQRAAATVAAAPRRSPRATSASEQNGRDDVIDFDRLSRATSEISSTDERRQAALRAQYLAVPGHAWGQPATAEAADDETSIESPSSAEDRFGDGLAMFGERYLERRRAHASGLTERALDLARRSPAHQRPPLAARIGAWDEGDAASRSASAAPAPAPQLRAPQLRVNPQGRRRSLSIDAAQLRIALERRAAAQHNGW